MHIELAQQVSFLNRVALTKALDSVPRGGHVLIDASDTDYIDADVLDLILEYQEETAPARGTHVSLVGFKDHYEPFQDRRLYADFTTRELQSELTPDQVIQVLRDGNDRFCRGERLARDLSRQREAVADTRHPLAIVLSGASSRTPIELIFDVGLGDIFCTRVSGNLVSVGVLGSLEFACAVAGAKLILVMGHENSALTKMAIEAYTSGRRLSDETNCDHLDPIVEEIHKSIDPDQVQNWETMSTEDQKSYIDELYRAHILHTIDFILQESPVLKELMQSGALKIVGGMYQVRSGRVELFEPPRPTKQPADVVQ